MEIINNIGKMKRELQQNGDETPTMGRSGTSFIVYRQSFMEAAMSMFFYKDEDEDDIQKLNNFLEEMERRKNESESERKEREKRENAEDEEEKLKALKFFNQEWTKQNSRGFIDVLKRVFHRKTNHAHPTLNKIVERFEPYLCSQGSLELEDPERSNLSTSELKTGPTGKIGSNVKKLSADQRNGSARMPAPTQQPNNSPLKLNEEGIAKTHPAGVGIHATQEILHI